MGIYLNPSNDLFYNDVTHSPFYIDKTMLIDNTNRMMFGVQKHICISRPRRFGKTLTMSMTEQFFSVNYARRGDLFDFRKLMPIIMILLKHFCRTM